MLSLLSWWKQGMFVQTYYSVLPYLNWNIWRCIQGNEAIHEECPRNAALGTPLYYEHKRCWIVKHAPWFLSILLGWVIKTAKTVGVLFPCCKKVYFGIWNATANSLNLHLMCNLMITVMLMSRSSLFWNQRSVKCALTKHSKEISPVPKQKPAACADRVCVIENKRHVATLMDLHYVLLLIEELVKQAPNSRTCFQHWLLLVSLLSIVCK